MNKYVDHDYIISQLLDYGVDKLVMLEQNFVNLIIQHRPKGIYNVNNTKSSNLGIS
jgi:hypothetical protein